jgi:hypothetical protein
MLIFQQRTFFEYKDKKFRTKAVLGDFWKHKYGSHSYYQTALVRERTIPTERPQLVGEISANVCE